MTREADRPKSHKIAGRIAGTVVGLLFAGAAVMGVVHAIKPHDSNYATQTTFAITLHRTDGAILQYPALTTVTVACKMDATSYLVVAPKNATYFAVPNIGLTKPPTDSQIGGKVNETCDHYLKEHKLAAPATVSS